MNDKMTIAELEERWERVLSVTRKAVSGHPQTYHDLKALARDIANKPLDIGEYLPTAEKLAGLLSTLDPNGRGSIFHFFNERITPTSIWHVKLLRMECRDLLSHLEVFDEWRLKTCRLTVVK